MMPVSPGFRDFLLDQLESLGDVTARQMFGELGLYHGDRFFGIVARDVVYFKVDAETRTEYERMGMGPFKPYPDRPTTMQYFEVPLAVLEDAEELARWARKAIAASERRTRGGRRKRARGHTRQH